MSAPESTFSPREILQEAGAHLTRAESLVSRAGAELGAPFTEGFERLAADIERTRRRLRNATTTATTTMGGGQ